MMATCAGDNLITVTGGADHVDGGLGDDRLVIDYHAAAAGMNGSSDSSFAAAGAGLVTVADGTVEHFTILAGSGINTLTTGGDDRIETAGAGANTIAAGDGNNTVITDAGADIITMGGGRDTIMAGDGANTITGLGGDMIITAASGADKRACEAISAHASVVRSMAAALVEARELMATDVEEWAEDLLEVRAESRVDQDAVVVPFSRF